MTVANPESTGAVEVYQEYDPNLGLEDVNASDLVMPRINIDHDTGTFVNSLTKEVFPALTCVILGLIKQRVMWPEKLEDGDKPMCKSTDNVHGVPRVGDGVPKTKMFPWVLSNYSAEQNLPVEEEPSASYPNGWSSNGYGVIACDPCVFAKWGKDEDNKSVPPRCSEQHTYPILYMQNDTDSDGNETGEVKWIPAIFTIQRSAIKNSRTYINGFAQSRQPMFTVYTGLTLRMESRGKNEYAVPEFKRMGSSDRNSWGEYGNQLRGVREFIRSAPRRQDDEDGAVTPVSNENTGPAPAVEEVPVTAPVQVPVAAPAAPPTPPVAPVAAPAPPVPHVVTAPPAPPAPPVAPPVAAPVAAPVAQPPVPPVAAPVAQPPTPPAAPVAAPAAPADDDDLPF